MEEKEKDGSLYGYVFHYNHYKDKWFAIPRNQYKEYWNGNCKDCISSDTIESLLSEIYFNEMNRP